MASDGFGLVKALAATLGGSRLTLPHPSPSPNSERHAVLSAPACALITGVPIHVYFCLDAESELQLLRQREDAQHGVAPAGAPAADEAGGGKGGKGGGGGRGKKRGGKGRSRLPRASEVPLSRSP